VVRYYFDVREGDNASVDDIGVDLSSRDSALSEAARTIAEMARDQIPKHLSGHKIVIEVRNSSEPVLSVSVVFEAELRGSEALGAVAPESLPSPGEVHRLMKAFALSDPTTKAEIISMVERYASQSPELAELLLKSKTKH